MTTALVIGAGPAGLMAADVLAEAGMAVQIADQMPSPARKFLMAGKSGLNITKQQDQAAFEAGFLGGSDAFTHAVRDFGPDAVVQWVEGLGQEVFTGSTLRVFPKTMKSSPLLRAWLGRLDALGVVLSRRWRWVGFEPRGSLPPFAMFETPDGPEKVAADVIVLALGGGSWRRLGSDGDWVRWLPDDVRPFEPSNVGVEVAWSDHMAAQFGAPVKSIALTASGQVSRGEVIVSRRGIEGGGVYALTPALRDGAALTIDLLPDLTEAEIAVRKAGKSSKMTVSQFLRAKLKMSPIKVALFHELSRAAGIVDPVDHIKAMPVPTTGLLPIDEAISTAGGLRFEAMSGWMLADRPGVFAAGEMLEWDAPTGGYLITACLASGRAAAKQAAAWVQN